MAETRSPLILILEDDEGIAELERLRLHRAGYRVQIAATTDEAKRFLASDDVDLLLLDYLLDDSVNGLEFCRSLREMGISVPTILVTGFSDETMLTEAIRSGVRDFLPKTTDFLDFLIPSVESVLKQVEVEHQLDEVVAQKKTLAEEDRRKDEFLAMLAHELRNPLSAISNAQHLTRIDPSEETRTWSDEVITRQIRQLSHLIDDLLDVSRIRLGKIQLRLETLRVADVVRRAVETSQPLIERQSHTLSVRDQTDPALVEADPTRLEQILVNLLSNAAKYTDPGGRIDLDASREDGRIILTVRDSGVGIAPEMLPKIFDPFVQVEGSMTRSQGGLGIGLTLVKQLVAIHGGEITVSSEGPGRGSEFMVTLPEAGCARESTTATLADAPRKGNGTRHVLVVDDNQDSARSLARYLRAKGHQVEMAHDGPSAIDLARSRPPEVVLLDIGLPGMDGYEVAEVLRQQPDPPSLLIAISGYGQDEDRRRSKAAGFHHHLVKPIDLDQVLDLIVT